MKSHRTDILICALIGLSFLWTGCAYLSWFYHLAEFYGGSQVDMLTEVFGYLMQSAGLLAFAMYKKKSAGNFSRYSFALISLTGLVLALLAALSPSGSVSLVFGYGMNAVFGMIAGSYLQMLAECASVKHSGIVFGAGYGIGSIVSFLISLIGDGNFLARPEAFVVYVIVCAASVPLSIRIVGAEGSEEQGHNNLRAAQSGNLTTPNIASYLWLPGITVLLLSLVKSGGFYFPAADLGDHNVSLELSRSFYAAGLIAAGLINDKRRSAGAVLCIAALVFPFFTMIAGTHSGINYVLWITGYIFFGFYAVYRVLLFTDISRSGAGLGYLACMGLMWGRLGDAAGAASGMLLGDRPIVLITFMAVLFVACIFLFFSLYQMMYMRHADSEPDYIIQFASQYGLSQRESDLLRLILGGNTNKEIAEKLFISENTVKFHVRNLLRKTDCKKRSELLSLFDSFRSPQ